MTEMCFLYAPTLVKNKKDEGSTSVRTSRKAYVPTKKSIALPLSHNHSLTLGVWLTGIHEQPTCSKKSHPAVHAPLYGVALHRPSMHGHQIPPSLPWRSTHDRKGFPRPVCSGLRPLTSLWKGSVLIRCRLLLSRSPTEKSGASIPRLLGVVNGCTTPSAIEV